MNLLEETLNALGDSGKSSSDVRWVGVLHSLDVLHPVGSWKQFEGWARDYNYDDGYGGTEVNTGLVIVGDDWWLERHEHDGSEWWEFKRLPIKPDRTTELRPSDLGTRYKS